jgi:hypothetical protein
MGPLTQSIGYHFGFPRMIVDLKIIILENLQPSPLSKVQVQLPENVLQTLVITSNHLLSHKVVPPNLESVNYSS